MQKESKAQRVERIKAQMNPLDVIKDIYRYAENGEIVDDETIDRLKWYGMYPHNKHSNDENKSFYMLRVKLPCGKINLKQLEVLGDISERFAQNKADFTVRQDIQFHYIKFKDLPEIFEMLESSSLTTQMASGDCPRNIVTCPLSGMSGDEIIDTREVFSQLNEYFQANSEFINLPRKYKIGICGCQNRCIVHEIQDLSFVAFKDCDEIRFNVYIGGGLASNKRFASLLGSVKENQIVKVAAGVATLFRDFGNRENRAKARIGHLVESLGILEFQKKLEEFLGFEIRKSTELEKPSFLKRNHFGKTKSKDEKTSHIGFTTQSGDVGGVGLRNISQSMRKYGVESIALTTTQNFIAVDVPNESIESFKKSLKEVGVTSKPSAFKVRALACTGLEFCKFAISETKELQKSVISHLENRFPDFDESVSITFSGCPNSCVHSHISDIGLIGAKVDSDSGFRLVLGAKMDNSEKEFAKKSKLKASSSDIHLLLEGLVEDYLKEKDKFGSFNEYLLTQSIT